MSLIATGIAAILGTLGTIATSLGLSRAVDLIDEARAKSSNVTNDDIIRVSQTMINEARRKGSQIIDKLADKLSSIEIPFAAGSAVRSFLIEQKGKVKDRLDNAKNIVNTVEEKLQTAEDRANAFAYQPDAVRSRNTDIAKEIATESKNQLDQINSLERSLK